MKRRRRSARNLHSNGEVATKWPCTEAHEKKKETSGLSITCLPLWSWRESNPRPEKAPEGFLHAYFLIGLSEFRLVQKQTLCPLILWDLAGRAETSRPASLHLFGMRHRLIRRQSGGIKAY